MVLPPGLPGFALPALLLELLADPTLLPLVPDAFVPDVFDPEAFEPPIVFDPLIAPPEVFALPGCPDVEPLFELPAPDPIEEPELLAPLLEPDTPLFAPEPVPADELELPEVPPPVAAPAPAPPASFAAP